MVSLRDQYVILVEDIADSGRTLIYVRLHPSKYGTKSDTGVSLAKGRPIEPDHLGSTPSREFIAGYGLEIAQEYASRLIYPPSDLQIAYLMTLNLPCAKLTDAITQECKEVGLGPKIHKIHKLFA